jgi:hypothetical protein
MQLRTTAILALTLLASVPCGAAAAADQVYPLTDAKGLVAHNAKAEAAEFKGRQAVRLTAPEEGKGTPLAVLDGVDFQDGVIDIDVATKITLPPGVRMPGFIGVAFRVLPDIEHHEMFYIRPGNGRAPDQAMRNHAVQYTSGKDYSWYKLRREWPWVYEASADLEPETWTHVNGLKGESLHGGVALFGYPGEDAYFSNLRITPATPQPLKNGSDATGEWQVNWNTDIGRFDGTLQLHRDGKALTGTWSVKLDKDFELKDLPVTGTWRDGYIEVTTNNFAWPKEAPGGPGSVNVTMAGWIDDAGAKGRMKIDGRTDGSWTATRASATSK